jgi:hypothetical protein
LAIEIVGRQQDPGVDEDLELVHVIGKFVTQPAVHAIQPQPGNDRRQASMHECRAVDDDDDRFFEQPATVLAGALERPPLAEKAGRELGVEFRAQLVRSLSLVRSPADIGCLETLAIFRTLVGREGCIFFRRDIAQVTGQIHRLVIADQDMHHTAGIRGFTLETHEQVHDVP